jgi:hydroxymethylpyrimidine/phosphomethylpyrimidine kinase
MSRRREIRPLSVLTIAGSDSGGGAGIQADLKTFDACGRHGLSAVTCVTAQNTRGVCAVQALPARMLTAQIDALFADFRIGAVKIGMLGTAALVRCTAAALRRHAGPPVVLDPVMISTSGARLLDPAAVRALTREVLPLAAVVTPNLPEAEALTGLRLRRPTDFDRAAAWLRDAGARAVLLKGGHERGGRAVVDRYYDAEGRLEVTHPRLALEGHGTGCTLAAALAAALADGAAPRDAVRSACDFVARALAHAYRPGRGHVAVLGHAAARTT